MLAFLSAGGILATLQGHPEGLITVLLCLLWWLFYRPTRPEYRIG